MAVVEAPPRERPDELADGDLFGPRGPAPVLDELHFDEPDRHGEEERAQRPEGQRQPRLDAHDAHGSSFKCK